MSPSPEVSLTPQHVEMLVCLNNQDFLLLVMSVRWFVLHKASDAFCHSSISIQLVDWSCKLWPQFVNLSSSNSEHIQCIHLLLGVHVVTCFVGSVDILGSLAYMYLGTAHSHCTSQLLIHLIMNGPSLFGGMDSGLDCGTGLRDWTEGLDSQKVALIQFRHSTHTTTLEYTYITWTKFRADGHHSISISIGPDEVLAAISADVRAIQMRTCMQAK